MCDSRITADTCLTGMSENRVRHCRVGSENHVRQCTGLQWHCHPNARFTASGSRSMTAK